MTRRPESIAFWEGRLPHWEVEDGRYFVTIHLAGAIPAAGQERIHALAAEFDRVPRDRHDARLQLNRRIYAEMEKWLDSSQYVPHLKIPAVAEMVANSISFQHRRVWNVFEYVIMPNHVHVFFEVIGQELKAGIEGFKRWTGHKAAKILDLGGKAFWQDEWFDHWSRSDEEDDRIVHYIQQNPVKAKLVDDYHQWPYGSWSK